MKDRSEKGAQMNADLDLLRRTIEIARQSRQHGNHPFGALLAGDDGLVLLEAENTVVTSPDCSGHAELNLVRLASSRYSPVFLSSFTLYSSTEPCPMCSGAIYWSGVGRVVYALSEEGLLALTQGNPQNDFLYLHCREIFARGNRAVEVLGPLLEEEARVVHEGFWD